MLQPRTETTDICSQQQANFCALFDEMFDQRSRLIDAALKTDAKVFFVDIFGQSPIEHDRDATFIFGSELAHRQMLCARGRFPVNVAQVITGLIIAKHQQVLASAAAKRSCLARLQRQEIQTIGDRFRLGINDDVDVASAEAATMPKEAEGKA